MNFGKYFGFKDQKLIIDLRKFFENNLKIKRNPDFIKLFFK